MVFIYELQQRRPKIKKILDAPDIRENNSQVCAKAIIFAKRLDVEVSLVDAIEYIPYYPYYP